jgi:hypothetical protein
MGALTRSRGGALPTQLAAHEGDKHTPELREALAGGKETGDLGCEMVAERAWHPSAPRVGIARSVTWLVAPVATLSVQT